MSRPGRRCRELGEPYAAQDAGLRRAGGGAVAECALNCSGSIASIGSRSSGALNGGLVAGGQRGKRLMIYSPLPVAAKSGVASHVCSGNAKGRGAREVPPDS